MKRFLSIIFALTQALWGLPLLVPASRVADEPGPAPCCCCEERAQCPGPADESAPCRPGPSNRGAPATPCCASYLPGARVQLVARADQAGGDPHALASARRRSLLRSLAPTRANRSILEPADAPTRRARLCIWTT